MYGLKFYSLYWIFLYKKPGNRIAYWLVAPTVRGRELQVRLGKNICKYDENVL